MKYYYREHCEVERAFMIFRILEFQGYIPLQRPTIRPRGYFRGSEVEFSDEIDSQLIARINRVPGVSFVKI